MSLFVDGPAEGVAWPEGAVARVAPALVPLLRPISELREQHRNARLHSAPNLDRIARSYQRFGQRKPLVAMPDGEIIAGSGSLAALRGLGWTHVAVAAFEGDVLEARAFALADNRAAEGASWDADVLLADLGALDQELRADAGFDLADFGDLDALMAPDHRPDVQRVTAALRMPAPVAPVARERAPTIRETARGSESASLRAPFPYFGGKSSVAAYVWRRFGDDVQHYVEPFCGSAAILLAAPKPAALEVVNDANGFIANFWRAVVAQSDEVARHADYPVSHVDLGARHAWLLAQRERLAAELRDAEWPGDAKVAGWWLWGQCAWIGSGWCEWLVQALGKIPRLDAGFGVQALGKIPRLDAGCGVQALGKIEADGRIPLIGNAGRGVQAVGAALDRGAMWTSSGRTALEWLGSLAARMERVRVLHGDWSRCLNDNYGTRVAVFLDPPYVDHEGLYGKGADENVTEAVVRWAQENEHHRVALCGHRGDYALDGWDVVEWSRGRHTYGGSKTTSEEAIWFSPACLPAPA